MTETYPSDNQLEEILVIYRIACDNAKTDEDIDVALQNAIERLRKLFN